MINIKYFGCSHSMIFGDDEIVDNNKIYNYIDKHQDSVSIKGLDKVNSKTNYKKKILNELNNYDNNFDILIFKIGQVDIEFGYYYKINNDNFITIDDFIDNLIVIYKRFLYEINYKKYKLIIIGISLPVYRNLLYNFFYKSYIINYKNKDIIFNNLDYDEKNNFLNNNIELLTNFYGNIEQQTSNSLLFNNKLKEMCDEIKIPYIDFTDDCLDKNTLLLKKELTPESDHHYFSINDKSKISIRKLHQLKIINLIDKLFIN